MSFLDKVGFSTLIVVLLILSLAVGFLPTIQEGFDDIGGGTLCESEGCYFNGSLDICYNGSDQGAACAATIPEAPLSSFWQRGGLLMVLVMVFIFIAVIGVLKFKK